MQNAVRNVPSYVVCNAGFFFSLHGKIVGRIWSGNNLLRGNLSCFDDGLSVFGVMCVGCKCDSTDLVDRF